MAAARSTLANVPTTSSAASNRLTTADPVCNQVGDKVAALVKATNVSIRRQG